MARKWTNSTGKNTDTDRNSERSLDRLRREVMTPQAYYNKYEKNNNRNRKGNNNRNNNRNRSRSR